MRLIDLPPDLEGSLCIIHEAMGEKVTARLVDREGAGVCYQCFAERLNLEVKLRWMEILEKRNAMRVPVPRLHVGGHHA